MKEKKKIKKNCQLQCHEVVRRSRGEKERERKNKQNKTCSKMKVSYIHCLRCECVPCVLQASCSTNIQAKASVWKKKKKKKSLTYRVLSKCYLQQKEGDKIGQQAAERKENSNAGISATGHVGYIVPNTVYQAVI